MRMPSQCGIIFQPLLLLSLISIPLAFGQSPSLLTSNLSISSNAITEWTAMGDSYASGIGAGALPAPGTDRDMCFRCRNAYPQIMQAGPGSLQPNPNNFNFVACSGATFDEIIGYQIRDTGARPGRPAWGHPEFVTLTMGGNDIGILPLILTCIYSVLSWARECDEVIQLGFDKLDEEKFKEDLFTVIYTVLNRGTRDYGPNFHIFVTGYAKFFNSETPQCDRVTFAPAAVVLAKQYLTRPRRRRMNELADALNLAIRTIVGRFDPGDVTFVDYDAVFEGHRFCDRAEPNPNDDDTWFFQLGTTSDPGYPADAMFKDLWRVFHPKTRGHEAIRNQILLQLNSVRSSRGQGGTVASHDTT